MKVQNWVIILLLILFFPVGLFLMWKYSNWNKAVKWSLTVLFGLFTIIAIASPKQEVVQQVKVEPTAVVQRTKRPEKTPEPSPKELNIEVKLNEVAYQVTNNEPVAIENCSLKMNDLAYNYNAYGFSAGETKTILFREFVKSNGDRFNPIETKAMNLYVSCDVEGEHRYIYIGR